MAEKDKFKLNSIVVNTIKGILPLIKGQIGEIDGYLSAYLSEIELHDGEIRAAVHGFNEVPPVFFTFATDIVLFRTTDNIARRKNCLKDFDRMAEAQARVNKQAVKNPHYFEIIKFA